MLPSVIAAGPVELRRLDSTQVDAVVNAITASLPELSRWFLWADTPPGRTQQEQRIRYAEHSFDSGEDFEFSLIEVSSGELVGGLRLNPNTRRDVASIGYWVRTDFHGNGFASAAVRAATQATFEHLPDVITIEIAMDCDNEPSVRVAAAASYTLTAETERPILTSGHSGKGFIWAKHRHSP